MSPYSIHTRHDYQYVDEGPKTDLPPVVLLHGMLGDVDNWISTIDALAENGYRVIVPLLPVYDLPLNKTSVPGLVSYVHGFLEAMEVGRCVLIGNSLGGHIALLYALQYPATLEALILTGSSGIYEMEMGSSTMRRRDRDFIRERAALTFYDPIHVTDTLVDEMFEVVNDRSRALRLIKMARSAQSETVTDQLASIQTPTLLVWGEDDSITPPDVAMEFKNRLPHATLVFIKECGHAPMLERPEDFNAHTLAFLKKQFSQPRLQSTTNAS